MIKLVAILVLIGVFAISACTSQSCTGPKKEMGPFGPTVCTD